VIRILTGRVESKMVKEDKEKCTSVFINEKGKKEAKN
jgi:hypothetical protein